MEEAGFGHGAGLHHVFEVVGFVAWDLGVGVSVAGSCYEDCGVDDECD